MTFRLGAMVSLQRGTTYQSALLDRPGPWLLGLASIARDGGFRGDSLRTYGGDSPTKLLVHPGDLYVSLKDVTQSGDLLGSVARLPASAGFGRLTQDTVRLDFSKNAPPRHYLYWALRSPEYRSYCRAHSIGTTNLSLPREDFLNFELPAPDSTRLQLADLLDAIEAKIDLNRQMNETLEAMARALFKSWFVDFDPVRAKMAGRAPFGMDAATAALFPSELDDGLPHGWSPARLGDLFDLQRGTTYESRLLGRPGPVLLGLGTIEPGGGFRAAKLKTYGGESPEKLLVRPGEMYVALKGATKDGSMVGSVARLPPSVPSGRLTQDTVRLVMNERGLSAQRMLHWTMRTREYREYCAQRATGSAQVGLSRDDFLNFTVPMPQDSLLCRHGEIDAAIGAKVDASLEESHTLAELRDLLLPKLLSGELRIRDAEKAVEAVI